MGKHMEWEHSLCGCCSSLPLLMKVSCLSEDRRGSMSSTQFYLRPTAPDGHPLPIPVLSHAGVSQEAALHRGQRSGKDVTNTHTQE